MSTNRSPPDAFSGILERLNGTVAKVIKLHQFLGDLESELSEICKECENEISARTAATDKGQIIVNQERKRDVMEETAHMVGLEGPLSLQGRERDRAYSILTGREQRRNDMEQERRIERPRSEPNHDPKSKPIGSESKGRSPSSIPGDSPLSVISGVPVGRNLPGFMSISRSWFRTSAPRHVKRPSVPQPPHPSPFPEDVDLACFPPELKREGPGWFILFNPSPKVKRVLDVNLVHTLTHTSPVRCVRFSPDGKWLATGCKMSAKVYNVKTGVMTCILDHTTDVYILSVCFSPDGKCLATGAADKQVRVWNITNNRCEHILKGHQSTVYFVDFSPDGRFIVSGSINGTVRVWDVHDWTFKVLTTDDHYYLPAIPVQGFFSVAISPDGKYVAAGSRDTVVRIWEMATGVVVWRLREHQHLVWSVAFTPNGKGLISGSCDRILKYWDVSRLGARNALTSPLNTSTISSSPCLMNLTGHTYHISSTSVSHDGTWVVSGSEDGMVLFWDIRTGLVQFMLSEHQDNGVYGVDLSPTGNFLATTGWDSKVRIWSYEPLV